jgi:hypothetical protein
MGFEGNGTRRLVSLHGLTAFIERNGYWHDEAGTCLYKVIGTEVFQLKDGGFAFQIVDGWAIDRTGKAIYYYGR